jgi:hypothetical protein
LTLGPGRHSIGLPRWWLGWQDLLVAVPSVLVLVMPILRLLQVLEVAVLVLVLVLEVDVLLLLLCSRPSN